MICTHRLWGEPDAPLCARIDQHDPTAAGGHVYKPSSGMDDEAMEDQ